MVSTGTGFADCAGANRPGDFHLDQTTSPGIYTRVKKYLKWIRYFTKVGTKKKKKKGNNKKKKKKGKKKKKRKKKEKKKRKRKKKKTGRRGDPRSLSPHLILKDPVRIQNSDTVFVKNDVM